MRVRRRLPSQCDETRNRGIRIQVVAEKRDCLRDRLEQAAGLGFERKHDAPAGCVLDADEVRGVVQQAIDDALNRCRGDGVRLECSWHRADAAECARAGREPGGEQVRQ